MVRSRLAEAGGEESVSVSRVAERACAKAAGRLRSPGQRDGGGSRRAPGLGLGAGLGPGAVLSVPGRPAVEVSAGRAAGGWFLEGCPSLLKFSIPWDPRVLTRPLVLSGTHGLSLVISSVLIPEHIMTFSFLCITVVLVGFGAYTTGAEMVGHNSLEVVCYQRVTESQWHLFAFIFFAVTGAWCMRVCWGRG